MDAATPDRLIRTAAELFARQGIHATSIRDLASAAGVNSAAINYHFAGKHQLAVAVLRFALGLAPPTAEPPATSEGDPWERLRQSIRDLHLRFLGPEQPRWLGPLVMRYLVEEVPGSEELVGSLLYPEHAQRTALIRRCRPDLSDAEVACWSLTILGQISFLLFAQRPLLAIFGQDAYPPGFLADNLDHLTRLVLDGLRHRQPQESRPCALSP